MENDIVQIYRVLKAFTLPRHFTTECISDIINYFIPDWSPSKSTSTGLIRLSSS